jgi:F0F1-type ATP synthase assembly protein I
MRRIDGRKLAVGLVAALLVGLLLGYALATVL